MDNEFDLDAYLAEVWVCPRCHSENIYEIAFDEVLDGVVYGYRQAWECGGCWNVFDEPIRLGEATP